MTEPDDIEERLRYAIDRDVVRHAELRCEPLPHSVHRRIRRRRAVRALGAAASVAVLGAGAAFAVNAARSHTANHSTTLPPAPALESATPAPMIDPAAPSASVSALSATPSDNGPVSYAGGSLPTTATPAPEPSTYVGAVGGGGEKAAVVDVATGKVLRWLTTKGDQRLWGENASHTTIYEPVDEPASYCSVGWDAVDVATGTTTSTFQGISGVTSPQVSADNSKLAYVTYTMRAAASPPAPVATMPPQGAGGCGAADPQLVVRDLATGTQRSWTTAAADTILQLSWSPDGRNLAYELGQGSATSIHVLAVDSAEQSVTAGAIDVSPPAGCAYGLPRFKAGTPDLLLALNCLGKSATLVTYDIQTHNTQPLVTVASKDVYGIIDLSVDTSGQHIIGVLSHESAAAGADVFVIRASKPVVIAHDTYQVSW